MKQLLKFSLGTVAGIIIVLLIFGTLAADNSRMAGIASTSIPLINPDFEDGFHQYNGIGELTVPVGWHPGWSGRRPEYLAHQTSLLQPNPPPGLFSPKMFVTYSELDGWLRQDVEVESDRWYRITALLYMRSEDDGGDVSGMICVNPWGNWDVNHRTTICGKEVARVYDEWVEVEVVAPSFGGRISVFLRGVAKWGVRWNDVYWDTVRMEEWEMGSGGCTPVSTICPTCVPGGGSDCASAEDVKQIVDERMPVIWTPMVP